MFVGLAFTVPGTAKEEKPYDPGASDAIIKIGNTAPYSGPLSSNGIVARTESACFKMINEQGGVNGRKIEFISYDDAYSPPKTAEQTRKLIESDEVHGTRFEHECYDVGHLYNLAHFVDRKLVNSLDFLEVSSHAYSHVLAKG
jgi:Periplasmic binding protein